NHGAKNYENVFKFYKFTIVSSIIINFIYFIISYFYGYDIVGLFTKDGSILNETYNGLTLFNLSFFIIGFNVIQSGYYQAINNPKNSNIISFLRSIIFFPITIFIGSLFWGLTGVWLSPLFSETLCFITWNLLFNKNFGSILANYFIKSAPKNE
ncbi:MAG: MATE family efflux transporter, partial [Cetobacterium sp.]